MGFLDHRCDCLLPVLPREIAGEGVGTGDLIQKPALLMDIILDPLSIVKLPSKLHKFFDEVGFGPLPDLNSYPSHGMWMMRGG